MASTNLPSSGAAGGFGSSSGSNAFLESTRTNVVVLQDLEGLCWRRYTLAPIGYGLSKNPSQQHALLTAFTRAIESGYASTVVHRSSRSGTQSPHFGSQMDQQMDLYVFWQQQGGAPYSSNNKSSTHSNTNTMGNTTTPSLELPSALSAIMASVPNCKVAEEGCWDKGMSYAVRCLLMKATNCLVQAQLARGGYHRIGRYFVRTYGNENGASSGTANSNNGGTNGSSSSSSNQQKPPYTIAFTLNYFVHGDGRQLCAFVNARRRPPLARLSARHLANGPENTNVILCPFGLSGHLTGKALTGSEATDFLTLFAHTCPVVPSSNEPNGLPSVVEIAIAGGAVHTFYPTHSLLVVDDGKSSPDPSCEQDLQQGQGCSGSCSHSGSNNPTATSSPTQRRVPDTPKLLVAASSTSNAAPPQTCDSHQPLGINILDLMSSGSDISTHPSVLPSPNCACSLSLTGKRTNTSSASHSAAKRPSFHRSCHLKAEEAVPSPLLSLSTQTNEEMSLLFPPLSVANLPAQMDQQQNDDCRSTVSAKNCVDSLVENKFVPTEQGVMISSSSSSSTTLTTATVVTTAAPVSNCGINTNNNAPFVNGGQMSPTIGASHEIVPRKVWPTSHDREMLQRATSASSSNNKNGGFIFGKAFQNNTNFQNDSSYVISMAFSKILSNSKNDAEDLVSLFGYDSLSCMAELSPVKVQNEHQHVRLGETTVAHSTLLNHHNGSSSHNNRHHSTSSKIGSQNHQQQHQSTLSVLLDSPGDMNEPLSVDRNRGENANTLDILATLGHSNNRLGSELPDNIFDVDSDASDGNDNSPGVVSGQGNGSTAPNSLDAHFPTPPTSVETNAPSSLRGLTPATASEMDHQQQQTQQLAQNGSTLSAQQRLRQNFTLEDPFSACESVFHPETSCAFVEGERYRPLSQLAAQSSGDELITIGSSATLISMKALRHEPLKSKSLAGSPLKQQQIHPQILPPLQREQPSPLSFLSSLGGPHSLLHSNNNNNEIGTTKSPEPNCLSQASPPKNYEVLQSDNLVTLLLFMSDSILDIHRDVNFDMAPLCACANSPMRGVDWPAYLRSNVDAEDAAMSADGNMYGNSGGADTPWPGPIAECSCGYSAVVNRRFASFGCGLLRDDECELLASNNTLKTIMKCSRSDTACWKSIDSALIRLIQKMCSVASPPVPFVSHIARLPQTTSPWTGSKDRMSNAYLRRMAVADKNSSLPLCRCRTCFAETLEVNSVFMSALMSLLESDVMEDVSDEDCYFFHNWMNTGNCSSLESICSTSELFRVLTNIHPLLLSALRSQEVQGGHGVHSNIGNKHQRELNVLNGDSKAGIPAAVANAGPLQLLSLFESGSDPVATAVPIPFVMASCEKEAIQLAPSALGPCWERNGLEPVAGAGRRLCYFSVRPSSLPPESNFDDEEQIETLALKYFINEVGRVMVDCRLASVHTSLAEASFPFSSHQPSQYAQKVPRMPIIVDSAIDNSPATPNRAAQHVNAQRDWLRTVQKMIVESLADRDQLESSYDGCICYVVVRDQAVAAQVLRLFSHLLDALPSEEFRERVTLQMVPTSFAALAWSSAQTAVQAEVRRIAFSIYTQLGSRWRLDRGERALTDTGPLPIMREIILTEIRLAAANDRKPIKYSPENASGLFEGPLRWPNSPIAVLARMKDQQTRLAECCGQKADTTVVVFAAYCPTPDQRFLLVSLTDDCGYIVKTGVLALEQQPPEQPLDQQPPSAGGQKKHRPGRLRPPVARAAVERVWCWLLGAITHSSLAVPIRVVLTRLGRLGHGEVRTWSALLSRQGLMQMSSRLQSACNHCQALPSSEVPCVISSCLISLEPHPWLRLMASNSSTPVATAVLQGAGLSDLSSASLNYGGEFRSAGKLFTCTGSSTYSSTHVFAFPTSAAIQAQTQAVTDEVQDSDQWDLLFPVDIDKDILDIPAVPSPSAGGGLMGFDELGGFGGLSASGPHQQTSRQNSVAGGWPRQSMSGEGGGGHNIFGNSAANFFGVDSSVTTGAAAGGGAAACGLLQQPLAVAFVVSTAPMGPTLPEWLCTIVKNAGSNEGGDEMQPPQTSTAEKPSALRAALHVHTASILPTAGTAAGGLNAGGLGSGGSTSGGAAHGGAGGTGSGSVNLTLQEHPLDSRRTVDVLRYAVEEHDALSWLAVDPATGQRMSCLPPHIVALINLHHMLHVFNR